MGMDLVEIVIRVEETFAIDLPSHECSLIRTVGDLFRLTLEKLKLPYLPAVEGELDAIGQDFSQRRFPGLANWTTPNVWATLRGIICDQLQVKDSDVRESATFLQDLRCD
jgi:acyl carrier protein